MPVAAGMAAKDLKCMQRRRCQARRVAGLDIRTYAETELVHSAVERKFEIIGEALNQIAKLDPWRAEYPISAKSSPFATC